MSVLAFLITATILWVTGFTALRALVRIQDRSLAWMLSYPIGVFINALLFFLLHIFGIPFSLLSVFGGHILLMGGFFLAGRFSPCPALFLKKSGREIPHSLLRRFLFVALITLLVVTIITTILAVTSFPMLYWDSFTHWAFRSKQMLFFRAIPFEGVLQPQYPILLHSLQVLAALPFGWSDTIVNTGTFLLTASLLGSLFRLIQKKTDTLGSLLTIVLFLSVPLMSIHGRQGYADIHVTAFILLSALLLEHDSASEGRAALFLSALFIAAASWTKFEGLYFGVLPWLLIILLRGVRERCIRSTIIKGILPACLLSLLWPAFVLLRGMNASPHAIEFEFHLDAFPLVLEQLFTLGTFGMHAFVILILLFLLCALERKRIVPFIISQPTLLLSLLSFILILCVYLFTKEVNGLIHRSNFSRAMLLPLLLFTQALSMEWYRRFYSPQPSLLLSVS